MTDTREAVIVEAGTYKTLKRGQYSDFQLDHYVKQGRIVLFPISNEGSSEGFHAIPHPETKLIIQPWSEEKGKWHTYWDVSPFAGVTLERYACNLEDCAEWRREKFVEDAEKDKEELQYIDGLIKDAWTVREILVFVGDELYCTSTNKIREMVAAELLDAERFSYFLEK